MFNFLPIGATPVPSGQEGDPDEERKSSNSGGGAEFHTGIP